jgi:predicted nucleotidyltransferase
LFRDRDFLQTREDFFFCVVGPFHPPDRVISYLKYVPARLGLWGKGKKRFRRVMRAYTIPSLLETFSLLERNYPQYLFHSPYYNITMTAVPHEYLTKHYKPEGKLAQLLQASRLDPLQKKLTRFTSFLAEISEVQLDFLGVTGSILLDIHQPEFSDLDLTVYGLKNSLAVREALTEAYSSWSSAVKRFEGGALKAWCESKAQRYPLTSEEALKIYERKWNLGFFENTPFSIHPVKLEQEVKEEYGDKIYYPVGSATVRAVVYENSDCLFLPCVYRVREVNIVEGSQVENIEEIVSYEGLYDNLAEVGESVVAQGKLERVIDRKTGQEYHRILVGSPEGRGMEYIKLL